MKDIIAYINAETEFSANVLELAQEYEQNGADGLYIYNYDDNETAQMEFLHTVKLILKRVDIPLYIGCAVKRFEDVKKALYTGASYVVIPYDAKYPEKEVQIAIDRFGKDKIFVEFNADRNAPSRAYEKQGLISELTKQGIAGFFFKHVSLSEQMQQLFLGITAPVIVRDSLVRNDIESILSMDGVNGIATNYYREKNILPVKKVLAENGIETKCLKSSMAFSEFTLNADGLIPVVVQDYRTLQVLMVAYMNEEAFRTTIETGKMTYYSRSRKEQWVKGETSGHYQYLKEISVDCDKDTLLAKVHQLGAACHTGNTTCFYTPLASKEYDSYNPLTVLTEDYNIILDRKVNPKPGSYTNYLFEKGIDKILKKCGEEATEITIAAKNPDAEELKYEIADYLYHLMVLMAECDVDWNDIVKELANRRKS